MSRSEGSKLEVQWSPVHKNKFITWGPDIRMYDVVNCSEGFRNNDIPKGYNLYKPNFVHIIFIGGHY